MYLSSGILNMLETTCPETTIKKRNWNDLQFRFLVGGHLWVRVSPVYPTSNAWENSDWLTRVTSDSMHSRKHSSESQGLSHHRSLGPSVN
jgi:hypothetical protein